MTTGDLISELWVTVTDVVSGASEGIGGAVHAHEQADLEITIRFLDPAAENTHGDRPSVARVDLIVGSVIGPVGDRSLDANPTTRVERRFGPDQWASEGVYRVIRYAMPAVRESIYLRVRGTNTAELEPGPDERGEDPWTDLWFYSNPVFVDVGSGH